MHSLGAAQRKPKSEPKFESLAWASTLGLKPAKATWWVRVYLDVRDAPAGKVYLGGATRFHLEVHPDQWNFLFVHGKKTLHVVVDADEPYVNGRDDFDLLSRVPPLADLKAFVAGLEKQHRVSFNRGQAFVQANIGGPQAKAAAALAAWLASP